MPTEKSKESFIRWQSSLIAQLTYSINLILAFSVTTLGFEVSLLLGDKFTPISWQKYAFLLSMLLLLVSIGIGIFCVVNRLLDFRATTKVAQQREECKSDEEVQPYRALCERLGQRTWRLFWWQIGTFGVGILLAVLGVVASASTKLL